jgi:hypothetical protein
MMSVECSFSITPLALVWLGNGSSPLNDRAAGSLRTSTRLGSDHDLLEHSGLMLIQAR